MIYNFKTEGCSPKDLRGYWSPLELSENKRDGYVNPQKLLKNQVKFMLYLNK